MSVRFSDLCNDIGTNVLRLYNDEAIIVKTNQQELRLHDSTGLPKFVKVTSFQQRDVAATSIHTLEMLIELEHCTPSTPRNLRGTILTLYSRLTPQDATTVWSKLPTPGMMHLTDLVQCLHIDKKYEADLKDYADHPTMVPLYWHHAVAELRVFGSNPTNWKFLQGIPQGQGEGPRKLVLDTDEAPDRTTMLCTRCRNIETIVLRASALTNATHEQLRRCSWIMSGLPSLERVEVIMSPMHANYQQDRVTIFREMLVQVDVEVVAV